MGQSNQKSEKQTPTSLNHKKMKHITFSKNGETMTASISVQDQQQFHKWEQKLSKLKKFDEYYLLIPKAYEFSKKGVCGSSGILNIDFDNYPYLLHDQILNRAQAGNFFTEVQLWYLLYGLVSAATIFKEVGFKVGDIQAKNVFLNEQGQMKVCNQCSWPSQRTNYQKLIFEGQPSYVSPQQVQLAKQGRVDIYQGRDRAGIDQYKSESFSIGLTMLQASLLALSDSLYNSSQKSINKKQLTRRLLGVMQNGNDRKYSKKLRQTIMALCQTSPQDRLSASQIYDKLKVHDSEITNLRQCEIQVPQIKLKQKYEVMMGKPNISQNAGYYTATASNTINNYNNSNSITGTNSTQLYYEPTHSNNSTYKAVTNTNANTNINTNKNTGGIHSLHGIHHNNNIGVINYSGTSNSNQPARVQVNFGPDKLQNGPFSDYKSGDNSLFVLSNTSPASSLYYTSPSSSNNYYGNLNPGSAPIPSSYLYSHSFANPLGNNSWKSGDGVNNSFGKNDIGSTSIQFGTQFSKKVQPYYSYPKPQQTKPITTATTKPVLEMGTGNSYLQSIYSSQQPAPMIKTPTFSTAPTTTFNPTQTFSSNLPSSNSYAFNNMALPPLPPINANRDIGKTQPNIGDLSEIKGYSFSNISSISRQHQYSDNKTADNIGVFTPTKQPSPSEAQKMNGDSMDLLKRIDEQILKSKSKFGESK